jgi:hypothetical protein
MSLLPRAKAYFGLNYRVSEIDVELSQILPKHKQAASDSYRIWRRQKHHCKLLTSNNVAIHKQKWNPEFKTRLGATFFMKLRKHLRDAEWRGYWLNLCLLIAFTKG